MARRNEPSPNRMKRERHSLFTERTHRSAKAFKFELRRKPQKLDACACQRLSEITAEFRIAVMQHIDMAAQISGFLVHRIAGHLVHPLLCGMARDACNMTAKDSHSPALENWLQLALGAPIGHINPRRY